MESIMICDYGCGNEHKFVLKNGKCCCSKTYKNCEAYRKRTFLGLKNFHLFETNLSKNFCKNSISNNKSIKKALLNLTDTPNQCHNCKISEWRNKSIVLELDHINGISNDNRLENIRLLCPNCHSQTETFRQHKRKGIERISEQELIEAINISKNPRQALLKAGIVAKGGNYDTVYRLIASGKAKFKID